ncbi:XdhC family protein [Salinimonas marina]|uniref:XdhC family protein n=1 Tax=Salinimonas marina TaxID=2785918 RepID=A0A7S9HBT9_9ALTE|nr:XdhC family protein [Salinimonas marina]QPG04414.1 XdhC family protein [Salinimonas marina]
MKHHFYHLLEQWYHHKDDGQWLLATIIETHGSAYRKAGAMMLFNDTGAQLGVVSGGCLESDLYHHAQKCWMTGHARTVTYDMREEGDVAWRLGIGCGGEVTLLLQPVDAQNDYLCLNEVRARLLQNQSVHYCQSTQAGPATAHIGQDSTCVDDFCHTLTPPPTLLLLGGGVDAVPVCDLASRIGWRVLVNDERARYARPAEFASASQCTKQAADNIAALPHYQQADAVIIMHHQVELDARSLKAVTGEPPANLQYLALLGPQHRTKRVLEQANLCWNELPLPCSHRLALISAVSCPNLLPCLCCRRCMLLCIKNPIKLIVCRGTHAQHSDSGRGPFTAIRQ